ncbi:hypothetical protein WA1_19215 [Scytonema hofmannii PCC 7110]|uniref:Uncharacterized protein n=1 Tax=Scytonema hofmannii PCC 7110 TaxID=128403 RepID=A0A139XBP0_9CYAN|nr:hypothetical protein [Scytonema hofmannii]KYC42128.1 hypothetical protein WA1_19215 [Scytonema hofmannii PCC 7110]
MAFIKIQNVIINTNYVVAVKLNNQTSIGENSISVLISTPKFSLLSPETLSQDSQDSCQDEWVEFTGQAAIALQDYFTSFNNVIDLLSNYEL